MAYGRDGIIFIDGDWKPGSTPVIRANTHGFHLSSSVFDGARAFEGVTPDLDRHCARLNASAKALGLKAIKTPEEIMGLVKDGLKKMESSEAIYIRPMYWPEEGGYMAVPPDPDTTRFLISLRVAPMIPPSGFSITVSPFRRPTPECATTDAKAGCLYPNSGRMVLEARGRGFDNALARDMLGNVVETATSNIFMVKDGVALTPAANGSFLAGITRARVIGLLREAGQEVVERTLTVADFTSADEIFSSGNHSKVVPVIRFEDRHLQPGPVAKRARQLYWDWAKSKAA
jgi:branched-chain amino acid aminotransferase